MRALKLGCGLLLLCSGACLSTQDVSLGALDHDAASAGDAPPGDPTPPSAGGDANALPDTDREEPEEPEDEEREDAATPDPSVAAPVDAALADAGSGDASDGDAGRTLDASSPKPDAASDASSADAGDVSIRCLLEPWEPWHCN